jgi:hypothetical protein
LQEHTLTLLSTGWRQRSTLLIAWNTPSVIAHIDIAVATVSEVEAIPAPSVGIELGLVFIQINRSERISGVNKDSNGAVVFVESDRARPISLNRGHLRQTEAGSNIPGCTLDAIVVQPTAKAWNHRHRENGQYGHGNHQLGKG